MYYTKVVLERILSDVVDSVEVSSSPPPFSQNCYTFTISKQGICLLVFQISIKQYLVMCITKSDQFDSALGLTLS